MLAALHELKDNLKDDGETNAFSVDEYLKYVAEKDKKDHELYSASKIPMSRSDRPGSVLSSDGANHTLVYKSFAICHSGYLPSRSRYNNLVISHEDVDFSMYKDTVMEPVEKIEYTSALPSKQLRNISGIPLVYDPNSRQACEGKKSDSQKSYFLLFIYRY